MTVLIALKQMRAIEACRPKEIIIMLRDTIVSPELMLNFWHAFMCTEHASDNVCDDWSMYCMGGEL